MQTTDTIAEAAERTTLLDRGLARCDCLTAERQTKLVWAFLALGLLARCVRYFLRFPLWEDEAFLCVNLIDAGYLDLAGTLQYDQVAPLFFLWIQLTFVKLFGFNELSLRLFGFVCSIASLFLFRRLATRLLSGLPLVLAVAVFSVAYPGIRYAAEAKQYASDLLVGLVLVLCAVEWWHAMRTADAGSDPGKAGTVWLKRLMWTIPLAVGLSLPSVFVGGGVSLFIAAVLWQQAQPQARTVGAALRSIATSRNGRLWIGFNVLMVGTFLVMFSIASRNASVDGMHKYWHVTYPPLSEPLKLPQWFLVTHTGDLLAYPVGGGRGASTLTFLAVTAGIAFLVRKRRWTGLLLCLAPAGVHMFAAAIQRYPYGGHVKFSQHMAPLICLVAGLGTAVVVSWLMQRTQRRMAILAVTLIYFTGIGFGSIGRDLSRPYKTRSDMRARAFAQWFWFNASFEGEVAGIESDLKHVFSPDTYRQLSWAATYLCNKRIYSPNGGQQPDWKRVSAEWPLRCVLYRDPRFEFDEGSFRHWLSQMQERYDLVSTDTFAFPRYDKRERTVGSVDYLTTYKFVPRGTPIPELQISGAWRPGQRRQ